MILKYKYHSDSCLLEAYRSYTLAQNNSLSDTIVITSTAPDAEKYNYCLEFICYNSKSIPKAQYISPILTYNEGISFVVPNNLTEFRGHVDMQLTGYDPDDNSIVFKSITKNCKAFDVEGSLCVLEKDLNDTPNVFTEVLKQLEDLKNIHQDIIDEAMERFAKQIFDMVTKYEWRRVRYYDYGKLIAEQWIIIGAKLNPPDYTLPENCVLVDGWYDPSKERIWDMENDTVDKDTDLYLNYMTQGVTIEQGELTSVNSPNKHIYIPEYYQGHKVDKVSGIVKISGSNKHIHFGNNMEDIHGILLLSSIAGLYFPDTNPDVLSADGYLYSKDKSTLIFAPRGKDVMIIYILEDCLAINTLAISNIDNVKSIALPNSMRIITTFGIMVKSVEEIVIPKNMQYLDDYAIASNNLKSVYFEGNVPEMFTDQSIVRLKEDGNIMYPKLYVLPQYYKNFKERGLANEIEVIGQDYFDGRYASKGE